MENIKFLSAENEIQKIYSNLGLIVPVGDLSTGKEPAVQPLPSTSTQDSITFNFNVMSGAEITRIGYRVNNGNPVDVTPQKGVVSITLEELEHNSGPYEIELTVFNENGRTTVTQTADMQPFTDWATANEVLEGNKFIANGEEMVGNIVTNTQSDLVVNAKTVAVPAGYYAQNAYASVSNDYIIPTGNLPITANGENIDVTQYATVSVNVSTPVSPLRIGHIVDWEYAPEHEIDGVTYTDGYVVTEVIGDGDEATSIDTYYTQQEFAAFMLENDYVRIGTGDPCGGYFSLIVTPGQEFDAYDYIENMVIAVLGFDCDACQELGCNEQEQSAEQ